MLSWAAVAVVAAAPVVVAGLSPLLAGRDAVWVLGGMAGVLGLSLLFLQPLLAARWLPGSQGGAGLRWHRWLGVVTLSAVLAHVVGLYAYSPEDIIDALLLRAPTPFSVYGVASLTALLLAAALAALLRLHRRAPVLWRLFHAILGVTAVATAVAHAWMIEGAMGESTKTMICFAALVAAALALARTHRLRAIR